MIKNFVFGGNYFTSGEFVLYINHSGKYIEINFNMKIPFLASYMQLGSSRVLVICHKPNLHVTLRLPSHLTLAGEPLV